MAVSGGHPDWRVRQKTPLARRDAMRSVTQHTLHSITLVLELISTTGRRRMEECKIWTDGQTGRRSDRSEA